MNLVEKPIDVINFSMPEILCEGFLDITPLFDPIAWYSYTENITSLYFQSHFFLLLCIIIASLLILILQVISYILSIETNSIEKHSSYECGFEPFGHAHSPINIQFYLIGILYLIFDLELIFFYPWLTSIMSITDTFAGFYSFILLIGLGFVYEWKQGGLQWPQAN
jgi:NADH-quinone oxidoreductase subunit A